jgi:4-amino-4-deoxy-L-arabinose transferase-like glycosyltransferase
MLKLAEIWKKYWIIILILLFALVLRLYFFFNTLNQPLWYDEAGFIVMARHFVSDFPSSSGLSASKEFVIPFFWGILWEIAHGEFLIRALQVIISLLTVFMTYLFAKELYDKKTAYVTSFMMAVNAIHLFFTGRILLYLWAPLFYYLVLLFFWKGYVKKQGPKWINLAVLTAIVGFLIYYSIVFAVFTILTYLIITKRLAFLKEKQILKAILLSVLILIPIFIYFQVTYGFIIPRLHEIMTSSSNQANNWGYFFGYLNIFPHMFGWVFLLSFILGLALLLINLFLSFDLVVKNEEIESKKDLFVLLSMLFPLLIFSYISVTAGGTVYDAFVFPMFPAFLLIASRGLVNVYEFIKKYSKVLAVSLIILILILGGYMQIVYANGIISSKKDSYAQFKEAGAWIKDNSLKQDSIIAAGAPELTYYSERFVHDFPSEEKDLQAEIEEFKPKYIVLSVLEKSPDWSYDWPASHNETIIPVKVYSLENQPVLIIYQFS